MAFESVGTDGIEGAVVVVVLVCAVEATDEVWPPFCANRVDDDDEEERVDGDSDEVDVELIELLLAAGVGEGWAAGAGAVGEAGCGDVVLGTLLC